MPWYQRWNNVFRPTRLDNELDDELQYHLAETVDRLVARGMSERDALQEARRRLGNYALQKERTHDMNISAWLDAVRADIFFGVRQLRRSPGFAVVAVLSLALGIGANTAIFQLVNVVRLKTLPVRSPEELVSLDFEKESIRAGAWNGRNPVMSWPIWNQIRIQQQAFSGVMAWGAQRFDLTNGGEPRFAEGLFVSGSFFHELGVNALLGRTFTEQDDGAECTVGAVVSYSFWQRELSGDRKALGRKVSLDGHVFHVIGVTEPSFFGVEVGHRYDVAIPLCADKLFADNGRGRIPESTSWWLAAMGRLKPGWTAQQATAHLHAISPGIMRATLPTGYNPGLAKRYLDNKLNASEGGTGVSGLRKEYERPLWLLMAIAGLVLLIACANLANLLLARATVREPEIAVRLAIGASRARLVCQLLAESLLLAGAGSALGVGLAMLLSRALVLFISTSNNPLFLDLTADWKMLGFTAALAVVTCLIFGLLPAWRATYLSPVAAMRAGGRTVTAGRDRWGLRRALVSTQVALSLVLVFGALLFERSLHNLLAVDMGFRAEGILSVDVDFTRAQYPRDQRLNVYKDLRDRLATLPGVASVAQVSFTPMSGGTWDNLVGADGAPGASGKQSYFNMAGPNYFRTMGIRLLAGRDFDNRDTATGPKEAVVNEMFARKFYGGANPVGHTFQMPGEGGRSDPVYRVIGLVANTKYSQLREEFRPVAYFSVTQYENPFPSATFVLRVEGGGRVEDYARTAIGRMNPAIGIAFRSLPVQLNESLGRERLMATLSEGFGLLAGLLATLGVYGVIAYMVARRRNEIGVRIALGAKRGDVIGLVLREAVLLLAVGLAAGAALAFWAGRTAATLLFGLQPYDGISLMSASALLAAVALIASYVPARRAAGLDPNVTLRNE
jgi:putative ABC transport system permease protein